MPLTAEIRRVAPIVVALTTLVSGCSGGGGSGSNSQINQAPRFTSDLSASANENSTGVVYTVGAIDPDDGSIVTVTLGVSADANVFELSSNGRELRFRQPPDFETPTDDDGNNQYELTFVAEDASGLETELNITVTVNDVVEPSRTRRIATGFSQPLFIDAIPGTNKLAVVEKAGLIRVLDPSNGAIDVVNFLDVTAEISSGGERGLLGLAFSPDFANDQTFYVNLTNPAGDTEIRRYQTISNSLTQADPTSGDVILTQAQPASNHNAGWIGFDANGLLLIPLGDGGGGGDPNNSAQNTNSQLGKLLRVDVSRDDFPSDPAKDYGIPSGNPFADGNGGLPEIFAIGLRNPYRNSIDTDTGAIYLADVGRSDREEIDRILPATQSTSANPINFGWSLREGTEPFKGADSDAFTPPVIEYDHKDASLPGRSVTGGYVHRGFVDQLKGRYVFGDFTTGNIWSVDTANIVDGQTITLADFRLELELFSPDVGTIDNVSSFGTDAQDGLYVVDFDGEVYIVEQVP